MGRCFVSRQRHIAIRVALLTRGLDGDRAGAHAPTHSLSNIDNCDLGEYFLFTDVRRRCLDIVGTRSYRTLSLTCQPTLVKTGCSDQSLIAPIIYEFCRVRLCVRRAWSVNRRLSAGVIAIVYRLVAGMRPFDFNWATHTYYRDTYLNSGGTYALRNSSTTLEK